MSLDLLYPEAIASVACIGQSLRGVKRVTEPVAPARGSKATPAYLTHSYPTKVPPEAIVPLIENFTRPGDLVCDPFAGSGMTGVAARRTNRNAYLNDLSSLAFHLAWNVNHPCDPMSLAEGSRMIVADVQPAITHWYRSVCTRCGSAAHLEWLLWGDTIQCPQCYAPVRLWDAGFDRLRGTMPRNVRCNACRSDFPKRGAVVLESAPVWASVVCHGGCRRVERPALHRDAAIAIESDSTAISDWFPTTPIAADREMYLRSALHLRGVSHVADFYTTRNLRALARMWALISSWPEPRVRQALAFAFTNTAWHGTRMRRYNARGGQRPLTGTLYIPQMSVEVNVLSVFQNKIQQLIRFYQAEGRSASQISVRRGSATDLSELPNGSVDYVFTDPPFGSNIFYADCNLIGESWLGAVTSTAEEAVVNRSLRPESGGKTVADYGALMRRSFEEIARVLKPGAWATVIFQNTDPSVWDALNDSLGAAGLRLARANTLVKTQQSHKGYRGRSGSEDVATFDMVLHLRRSGVKRRLDANEGLPEGISAERVKEASALLQRHLVNLAPIGTSAEADQKRTLPFLYALLLESHFNGDIGLHARGFGGLRDICADRFVCDTQGRWQIARRLKKRPGTGR